MDEVYIVAESKENVSMEQVEALGRELGMELPRGYAEFITRLGVGIYCDLLRVYGPERILRTYEESRKRWDEHFFWERGSDVLTKEEVLACVVFGDSIDGDEIIAHPLKREAMYVLPRHDNVIYRVPRGFEAPMEWHGPKGVVLEEPGFRFFEGMGSRKHVEFIAGGNMFAVEDLAPYFSDFWSQFGRRVIRRELGEEDEGVEILFVEGIGGRLQLVESGDEGKVRVRLDYDEESEADVAPFREFLSDMGFVQV